MVNNPELMSFAERKFGRAAAKIPANGESEMLATTNHTFSFVLNSFCSRCHRGRGLGGNGLGGGNGRAHAAVAAAKIENSRGWASGRLDGEKLKN